MSDRIRPEHLQREAIVYIRQSSPGQVKNHRESYRVQKGLVKRAQTLGWTKDRVHVVQGDQGTSASLPGNRQGFDDVLQRVQNKRVGIVLGQDASRLARNSLDWALMTHWCALHDALIGDQTQVLDPALPQDSLVLGIQGTLAVHEVNSIRQRLGNALREKASRGELHHGVQRGYVLVDGKHLRKHPDRRVQQAVARVFGRFKTCASVNELLVWLWDKSYQLPRPESSDGMEFQMVDANYSCLLDMLQNPVYAGLYAHPRFRTETDVLADGTVRKKTRRARPEEWEVRLEGNHPAYIDLRQYEANQEKIAMNAQRFSPASRGSANKGRALLAGLIECRRCHHKMQVHYDSQGRVTYSCQRGKRQRDRGVSGCLRLAGEELERQLSEQILYAVSPAGVEAALLAGERLASERATRRAILSDELEQFRYEADLARRRFDNVDPANRLLLDTLASEVEAALAAVAEQEAKLAWFDQTEPERPTPAERAELERLGSDLEAVWYDANADHRLKQQIVRELIKHVVADVDEATEESVLWLHWTGGHHTELRAPRRRGRGRKGAMDLSSAIDTLCKIADDEEISRALNRAGIRTERGESWTRCRVSRYRQRLGIAAYNATEKAERGWLSQSEAATKLGISPMSVNRLIQRGILRSEGESRLPQVIQQADLNRKEVIDAVKQIKSHGNAPLPKNPKQPTLFQ
jgi:DNA invertase Pin-like site-specific DNA recombinase